MLTIEKASKLLNIAFSEYPSLKDEERIAIFTKKYFILIVDINNNLVTAFQGSEKQYKKYLKLFSK